MTEFYLWTRGTTYIVTFMFALCILSQTLAVMVSFYRFPRSFVRILETLIELFILCNVFVCSLLHGATREAHITNILVPSGYIEWRIGIFVVIFLLVFAVIVLTRKLLTLFAIVGAGLTLPFVEQLTGTTFAYIFISVILFWLVRGIVINLIRYKEIKTSLSALSVKHLIDSMDTGLMFFDKQGFILLSNTKMQQLMLNITGKVQRNGTQFHKLITLGEINPQNRIVQFEDQNVVVLPDNSAWIFTLAELEIKGRTYFQLEAMDITERWKLTAELQEQNTSLIKRQDELKNAIANLHIISREKERQNAKIRTHDILSERLALLRQAFSKKQTGATVDYTLLRDLSDGLNNVWKTTGDIPLPLEKFGILKQTFSSIGVNILLKGTLPLDNVKGHLVMDITREAVSNAVRHGLATEVKINTEMMNGNYRLEISDNGHGVADRIIEGGGLSGMRERVKPFGGIVKINDSRNFTLFIDLPMGETSA